MMRGLLGLTWLEIKIFVREPMGVIGTIGIPVLLFVVPSRMLGPRVASSLPGVPRYVSIDLPIFASLLIAASAVLSLVAIIAIYREGGILKRLRATPLRPHTILTAHVLVKLLFTALTLAAWSSSAGATTPSAPHVPLVSFTIALLVSTLSILSLGFLIASIVPTARFAQPIGTAIVYPMIGLSGLFVPVGSLPPQLQVDRPDAAVDLCRLAPQGHLARRRVGRPRTDVADARGAVPGLHRDFGKSVSLGVIDFSFLRSADRNTQVEVVLRNRPEHSGIDLLRREIWTDAHS